MGRDISQTTYKKETTWYNNHAKLQDEFKKKHNIDFLAEPIYCKALLTLPEFISKESRILSSIPCKRKEAKEILKRLNSGELTRNEIYNSLKVFA